MAWPQWIFVICLVIIHTCLTFLVNLPGCPKRYIGPGGLDEFGKYPNCTGGVAGYIDRKIFGNHMYKNPPCHILYETNVYYDPEGKFLFCKFVVMKTRPFFIQRSNKTCFFIFFILDGQKCRE